jgi:hypothetical protein
MKDANVNAPSDYGYTPLTVGPKNRRDDLATLLWARGGQE